MFNDFNYILVLRILKIIIFDDRIKKTELYPHLFCSLCPYQKYLMV